MSRRRFAREVGEGVLYVAYGVTRVVALSVIWAFEGRRGK